MQTRERFVIGCTLASLTACVLQPPGQSTPSAAPSSIPPTASTLPSITSSPTFIRLPAGPAANETEQLNIVAWGLDGIPDDNSFGPSISSDGRFVAFASYATNLTDNADPYTTFPDGPDFSANLDVFLADLTERTVTLISRTRDGSAAEGSDVPHISPDGRYVVFGSSATGLTDDRMMTYEFHGTVKYVSNVYSYDRVADTITLITHSVAGNQSADRPSGLWDISPDGSTILIGSSASDLTHENIPKTDSYISSLYLYEVASDTMTHIPLDGEGQIWSASFSPDGSFIYYVIGKEDPSTITKEAYTYNRLTGQRRSVGPVAYEGRQCGPSGQVLNDGTAVVIAGPKQDPRYPQEGVYLISPTGEDIRRISEPHPQAKPPIFHHRCLQARGNMITFAQSVDQARHRLFLYRLDTGTLTEMTSGFSPELVAPEMVLSPQAVLFMIRDPNFDVSKELEQLRILYRYDVATGQVSALTDKRVSDWIGIDAGAGYQTLPAVAEDTERVVYMTHPLSPEELPGFPDILAYVDP